MGEEHDTPKAATVSEDKQPQQDAENDDRTSTPTEHNESDHQTHETASNYSTRRRENAEAVTLSNEATLEDVEAWEEAFEAGETFRDLRRELMEHYYNKITQDAFQKELNQIIIDAIVAIVKNRWTCWRATLSTTTMAQKQPEHFGSHCGTASARQGCVQRKRKQKNLPPRKHDTQTRQSAIPTSEERRRMA